MTEVVLFHHAQGLTSGVLALADDLRAAGHTVHTPDFYAGLTFATLDEGMAHLRSLDEAVTPRIAAGVEGVPADVVYAGMSCGVMAAQDLLQQRPGARGGLFLDSFIDPVHLGPWPGGVPVQVHGMDADPWFAGDGPDDPDSDLAAARAVVERDPLVELHLYPGDQHLFADRSLASYDEAATALLLRRALDFLASVG